MRQAHCLCSSILFDLALVFSTVKVIYTAASAFKYNKHTKLYTYTIHIYIYGIYRSRLYVGTAVYFYGYFMIIFTARRIAVNSKLQQSSINAFVVMLIFACRITHFFYIIVILLLL